MERLAAKHNAMFQGRPNLKEASEKQSYLLVMICKFMILLWVINKTSTRNLTVIKWPFSQFSTKDSDRE